LRAVDPTPGQPGLNAMVALPVFPRASLAAPAALWTSDAGRPIWHVGARPPGVRARRVCHVSLRGGVQQSPDHTRGRNRDAARAAKALASTEKIWDPQPVVYSFDTMVPLPAHPKTTPLVSDVIDPEQVKLAYAHAGSQGGYKVMGLRGLAWSAPYLHDGGVVLGPDPSRDVGIPGTWGKRVAPDAGNSLRALVDRELRARVIDANHASRDTTRMNVEGIGHALWVDRTAGYKPEEQSALVGYLLSL